jgi:hypothetical protein
MRIREILEARRNPSVNNERNGRDALLKYLKSLDDDTLARTYVHFSTMNKLGVNPGATGTGKPFEPMGIFTYPAREYLKRKGNVGYAGNYPIAHVITIKSQMHKVYVETDNRYWEPRKFYARLEQEYPNIEYGDSKGRFLASEFLIKQGYNLIVTNQTYPLETVILNPKSIEKDKIITIEFVHPKEITGVDSLADGEWNWYGQPAGQDWGYRHGREYDNLMGKIADKKILSRSEEYNLFYNSPKYYKKYVDQVLAPQGLQSKLSAQEIKSISKKHQSATKRRDTTDPRIKFTSSTPSLISAKRLFDYGVQIISQGKQLSKNQEITLAQKGVENATDVDLLTPYYNLLRDAGMTPKLTATELKQAQLLVPTY